jgi:hypothetical protein
MHALLYTLLRCLADAVTISPSAEGLSKVYYNKGQCDSKSKVCVTRLAGPRRALSGQTHHAGHGQHSGGRTVHQFLL